MGVLGAQALVRSLPVSLDVACKAVWGNCHTRCFATKGKSIAHVIRWNAENKILFGSKHKSSKKAVSSSDAAKKISASGNATKGRARSKRAKVDESTKYRLEEMYIASAAQAGGGSTEAHAYINEDRRIAKAHPVESAVDQDFYPEKFWGETPAGTTGSKLDDFLSVPRPRAKSHMVIPKILPIPEHKTDKTTLSEETYTASKNTQNKTKLKTSPGTGQAGEEMPSPSQHTELQFVLQCPLFPEQFPETATPGLDFSSRVESFGLRLLPTVKTILGKTRPELSNFFLQRWREKMIQELGEDGFKKHQEAVIWQGVNLHACVQQFLSGIPVEDIQIQENNRGHWSSISDVLPRVSEVEALETNVSHPWLQYKGTVDCVAKYKNILCVIDWKTASKPKPLLSNLFDDPLQVVAYMGAINHSAEFKSKFGAVDQAAIVVAYPNGEAAHVHMLSRALCLHYWEQWCQRLHQYWGTVFAQKCQ